MTTTLNITKPTALLDETIARRNIQRMADKATRSGVRFRPHLKTPQSGGVGDWFLEAGVTAGTVSSVSMAQYFAENGWQDITIAFPVNWLEIDAINDLAAKIQLNLLVESPETAKFLSEKLTSAVKIWLEIDAGDNRTGIDWQNAERLKAVAHEVYNGENMTLTGLLTHRGYKCFDKACLEALYQETVDRLSNAREVLQQAGFSGLELSTGDTPCCTVLDDFSDVDEIRPGNFVFFDLWQMRMNVCAFEDIAVIIACPVVAVYPERNTIALYGGGVHLSKDRIKDTDGSETFGALVRITDDGWELIPDTRVYSLSQEHGMVKVPEDFLQSVQPGDVVGVIPVHSCMSVDLLKSYRTVSGETLSMMAVTE